MVFLPPTFVCFVHFVVLTHQWVAVHHEKNEPHENGGPAPEIPSGKSMQSVVATAPPLRQPHSREGRGGG